ncbi:hypothetical protein [Acinetobacter indicus]|uniref:hypothetical protein n=1 Tax=Acinetobacter indicus TaxID=756892 RepID=UPI0012E17D9B|nr:hypothetical protein [Acinetobacter indicus]
MTQADYRKDQANNHKEWFFTAFGSNEIEQLRNIGIECQADHQYFKNEILDIFGCIQNRKLKKLDHLYQKFIERYIELIPTFLVHQIDRVMLENDAYYAAWFFNRHCFFMELEREREKSLLTNKSKLFLWSPVIDIHSPKECEMYENKIFSSYEILLEHAVIHWEQPRRGCRCALLVLNEDNANKRIESGQYTIWKS